MTQDSQAMLVTADQSLAREVLRLAAAAGVDPLVVATPSDALRLWSGFGVILVGVDLASACAQVAPPRRNDVHVLSNGAPGSEAFAQALAIGAQSLIDLAGSPSLLLETLSNVGEGTNPPAVVVGVIGGAGGAGASVLAAALARVSSWTQPTLLIDADPLGAGSDRLFGLEFAEGA
ncbi:MAG TPA: septum site determining protein, partial [Marmoricola sp.]|nr:septum site determining protein [Marmoricola sp.]